MKRKIEENNNQAEKKLKTESSQNILDLVKKEYYCSVCDKIITEKSKKLKLIFFST